MSGDKHIRIHITDGSVIIIRIALPHFSKQQVSWFPGFPRTQLVKITVSEYLDHLLLGEQVLTISLFKLKCYRL